MSTVVSAVCQGSVKTVPADMQVSTANGQKLIMISCLLQHEAHFVHTQMSAKRQDLVELCLSANFICTCSLHVKDTYEVGVSSAHGAELT